MPVKDLLIFLVPMPFFGWKHPKKREKRHPLQTSATKDLMLDPCPAWCTMPPSPERCARVQDSERTGE